MRVWLAGMTALLGFPMATAATDINSGITSELHWTDNVYSQSVEEIDDYSTRVSPWVEIADPDGEVTWGLRYKPSYEYYLEETDPRGFDHEAETRGAWRINGATTLRIEDRFRQFESLSRFNEQSEPGEDVVVAGRGVKYTVNVVNASLEHLLSPRDFLVFNLSYNVQEFSEQGQGDRDSFGSSAIYRRQWSQRAAIGAIAAWSRQSLDQMDFEDRETDYINLSALFSYEFSRTLHFEASAGPALILSDAIETSFPATVNRATFPLFQRSDGVHFIDADTCPRNSAGIRVLGAECQTIAPALSQGQLLALGSNVSVLPITGSVPDPDDSTSTYFADVSLVKEWQRLRGLISYRRSEDVSTGVGAVSDTFYGSLRWEIAPRFAATLSTSYQILDQATEGVTLVTQVSNEPTPVAAVPLAAQTQAVSAALVGTDAGLDIFVTRLQLNYELSRRATLFSNIIYRDEATSGDVFIVRDMQRFGISFGLHYVFAPIEL